MKQKKQATAAQLKPLNNAQQKLVEQHYPLAMNLGRSYAGMGRNKGIPLEDLQQEACLGLCMAARNYDAAQGAEFRTYAFVWCRKYILLAIEQQAMLTPEGEPFEDADNEEADIADDTTDTDEESEIQVPELLKRLNAQERQVVCQLFGITEGRQVADPQSIRQIADQMHLQPRRIHQIYEQAMAKME